MEKRRPQAGKDLEVGKKKEGAKLLLVGKENFAERKRRAQARVRWRPWRLRRLLPPLLIAGGMNSKGGVSRSLD